MNLLPQELPNQINKRVTLAKPGDLFRPLILLLVILLYPLLDHGDVQRMVLVVDVRATFWRP
jgi:hypothetical protein